MARYETCLSYFREEFPGCKQTGSMTLIQTKNPHDASQVVGVFYDEALAEAVVRLMNRAARNDERRKGRK